jgi:predicted DNA-binding transcriptional regulator AlpA
MKDAPLKSNQVPWADIPPTGPLLRPRAAAEYLGLSVSGFYKLVSKDKLPSPIRFGVQASGVPQPWLDAVIARKAAEAGR